MNEKQIKQLKKYIKEEEKGYDFNDYVENYINDEDLNDIESSDDLKRYLEDLNEDGEVTDEEVIYYSNAIEYLKENDASLNYSIEISKEYGYTIDNINSEILASLLKTQENEENYYQFIEDICAFYDEIKED